MVTPAEFKKYQSDNLLRHLRARWPEKTKRFTDKELRVRWDNYYFSDAFGNNDARFPEFLEN